MVLNGEAGPTFDRVWFSDYSSTGSLAHIGKAAHGGECVVLDSTPGPRFDVVRGQLEFRPDGGALGYGAATGRTESVAVFEGGRLTLGRPCDRVGGFTWSADGGTLAYVATRPDHRLVVIGDVDGGPHDMVREPVVSADGAVVAYAATDSGRSFMIINEEAYGPFDECYAPVVAPDGLSLGFAARLGGEIIWHDVRVP